MRGWILALILGGCMPRPSADPPAPADEVLSCAPDEAAFVYRQRIEPLVSGGRAASCNQCHLQGIDLSAFVRGDACQSMACLLSKEMVDFESPEDSRILGLIDRARGGPTPAIAEEEHAGFLAWIRYSARCHAAACDPIADPCGLAGDAAVEPPSVDAGPPSLDAALDAGVADAAPMDAAPPVDAQAPDMRRYDLVPDHLEPCSPGQLVTQFQLRVMIPWRRRCHHCHADDGLTRGIRGAPLWMVDREDFQAARETVQRILERGYVTPEAPDTSLILLKPLHQRYGGVEHGGGNKFTRDTDPAYLDFKSWTDAIARCGVPDVSGLAPMDAGVPDGGVADAGGDPHDAWMPPPDGGPPRPLNAYCDCMLARCHDTYHRLWGEDDSTARVVCLQRAARLDDAVLACRATVCAAAPEAADGSEDAVLCAGAVGDGLCE